MKILTVVGARPQFIKAAVVSRAFKDLEGPEEQIIHTGQHYDPGLSDIFFDEMEIPRPTHNLNVGSGSHGKQTGAMLAGIEEILLSEEPDRVLVYGDTNSTLAGALAAAKLHIPVDHVEAGLRSFNRDMPEEVNRVLTDHVSSLLLCPTSSAVSNLISEGIHGDHVKNVGDVMLDAARFYASKANKSILERLGVQKGRYILATVHRAENTDNPTHLTAILDALATVANDIPVILPLHPRTANILSKSRQAVPGAIQVIEPVGFLDMVALERDARLIATDSGGVQKEAFFHGRPCVTLREETEWVELVESGWNRLVPPTDPSTIEKAIREMLDSRGEDVQPYGDGHAGQRIADIIAGQAP